MNNYINQSDSLLETVLVFGSLGAVSTYRYLILALKIAHYQVGIDFIYYYNKKHSDMKRKRTVKNTSRISMRVLYTTPVIGYILYQGEYAFGKISKTK